MYPLDNLDDIYKYIWDYNIKLAFDHFYGENKANNKYLLRIDGKPVLFLWSINGFLNVDYAALGNKKIDCKGKLKAILDKIPFYLCRQGFPRPGQRGERISSRVAERLVHCC